MLLMLCKLLAVGMWSASVVLLLIGMTDTGDPLDVYAISCWLALAACVPTGHVVVHHAVCHALRQNRQLLAEAVGLAIGEELGARDDGRDDGTNVRPIR